MSGQPVPHESRDSPLAPELEETIRAALARLDEAIAEAAAHSDPIRLPLVALRSHLGAQHRLFVDGCLSLTEQVAAARPAFSAADISRMTRDIGTRVLEQTGLFARVTGWRSLVQAGAVLLVFFVLGGAAVWLQGHNRLQDQMIAISGTVNMALAGPDAAAWARLMRANADGLATQYLKACETATGVQQGRHICTLTIWLDPPGATRPPNT